MPDPTPTGRTRGLLRPLVRALGVLVLAIVFAVLGSEIEEGETQAFDMALLQQAMSLRAAHPGFAAAMRDLSGVGSTTVTSITVASTPRERRTSTSSPPTWMWLASTSRISRLICGR